MAPSSTATAGYQVINQCYYQLASYDASPPPVWLHLHSRPEAHAQTNDSPGHACHHAGMHGGEDEEDENGAKAKGSLPAASHTPRPHSSKATTRPPSRTAQGTSPTREPAAVSGTGYENQVSSAQGQPQEYSLLVIQPDSVMQDRTLQPNASMSLHQPQEVLNAGWDPFGRPSMPGTGVPVLAASPSMAHRPLSPDGSTGLQRVSSTAGSTAGDAAPRYSINGAGVLNGQRASSSGADPAATAPGQGATPLGPLTDPSTAVSTPVANPGAQQGTAPATGLLASSSTGTAAADAQTTAGPTRPSSNNKLPEPQRSSSPSSQDRPPTRSRADSALLRLWEIDVADVQQDLEDRWSDSRRPGTSGSCSSWASLFGGGRVHNLGALIGNPFNNRAGGSGSRSGSPVLGGRARSPPSTAPGGLRISVGGSVLNHSQQQPAGSAAARHAYYKQTQRRQQLRGSDGLWGMDALLRGGARSWGQLQLQQGVSGTGVLGRGDLEGGRPKSPMAAALASPLPTKMPAPLLMGAQAGSLMSYNRSVGAVQPSGC